MKIYGQKEVDITETRAKTLLAGQSILISKIPSKTGKEYDAYFKLEIKDKFVNLSFDRFKDVKKNKTKRHMCLLVEKENGDEKEKK